jgi:hypothetical protein
MDKTQQLDDLIVIENEIIFMTNGASLVFDVFLIHD